MNNQQLTINNTMLLPAWNNVKKIVIGMLHLPPLPGSPLFSGDLSGLRDQVLRDAELLTAGGVHGLMLENFGDIPFFPERVPAYTVAHMAALAVEVKRRFPVPLGINCLRNDGLSALAIAHAAGAEFIRVNVLTGARVTDQGPLSGIAHDLLRERALLRGDQIKIFADVDVKHSAPLAPRPIGEEVEDTLHRGLADALVVSGAGTGKPTDPEKVKAVKQAAKNAAVFLGSGVTPETVAILAAHADGFIVGTYFKKDGVASNPVDPGRVRALMEVVS
jgi:membrane complex biogenesis BtpA family protein